MIMINILYRVTKIFMWIMFYHYYSIMRMKRNDDVDDYAYDQMMIMMIYFIDSLIMIVSISLSTESMMFFIFIDKLYQVNIHLLLLVKRLPWLWVDRLNYALSIWKYTYIRWLTFWYKLDYCLFCIILISYLYCHHVVTMVVYIVKERLFYMYINVFLLSS